MRLVILTEAGFEIGFGHFVRMSALGSELSTRGVQVVTYLNADVVARRSLDLKHMTLAAWNSQRFIANHVSSSDVVLVDSYHVNEEFLRWVRSKAGKLMIVDDNVRLNYEGVTIINPNYFAEWLQYPTGRGNVYLLGKDYTMLRKPFEFTGKRVVGKRVNKVLVTLGGTDVKGVTVKVIRRIREVDQSVSLRVVVTDAYRNLTAIPAELNDSDKLVINASAQEMRDLMLEVDFAVSAAGGTSNELIKMQCPSALLVVADNQNNTHLLHEHGLVDLLTLNDDSALLRMFTYKNRMQLVDSMAKRSSNKCAADAIASLMKGIGD